MSESKTVIAASRASRERFFSARSCLRASSRFMSSRTRFATARSPAALASAASASSANFRFLASANFFARCSKSVGPLTRGAAAAPTGAIGFAATLGPGMPERIPETLETCPVEFPAEAPIARAARRTLPLLFGTAGTV